MDEIEELFTLTILKGLGNQVLSGWFSHQKWNFFFYIGKYSLY